MTAVKICCIQSIEEMQLAVAHNVTAIGLVSWMPSGQGPINETLIAEIAAATPKPVRTFLLTCLKTSAEILAQHLRCKTSTIQLTDWIERDERTALRAGLHGVNLVQVIHVEDESAIAQAHEAASWVDELLLDSGRPGAAIPELGGTGRTHNWVISREVVRSVAIPVWLAGGLKPENVAAAINFVKPYGVDICSGVRVDGGLDESRITVLNEVICDAY